MNSTATLPPDSFYIDFLKKVYPNNQEYHKIPEGLIKFAQDQYPQDKNLHNPELAKRVIRNRVGRGVQVQKVNDKYSKYTRKTISQFLAEEFVEVTGVVIERLPLFSYQGCSKFNCGKKQCEHPEPKIALYFHNFKLVDDTGEVMVSIKGDTSEFHKMDVGDRVRLFGKVKRYREELSISVYEIQVIQKMDVPDAPKVETEMIGSPNMSAINRLVEELKEFSKIPQKIFEQRMMQEGIKPEELKGKITLKQDGTGSWYELAT